MNNLSRFSLLADLYEFTMAATYHRMRMSAPATFSLFIREYPQNRGYFVSAGLEDVLRFLEAFHFEQDDLDFLKSTGLFEEEFLHFLGGIRFTGEVFAIPEGRLFFKDEPVIEITAPIIEAQLVETFVINAINLQVMIASKAARCVYAAKGRSIIDFSLRRTQGIDAGLKAARASFIAGCSGTSNVLAGKLYGIPVSGTMAHSYITSFKDEADAFRAFAETFPDNTVLLIDTYDTTIGARNAALVGKEMKSGGKRLKAVRLDSGDIALLSKKVRQILDEAGLEDTTIFASGALDEHSIAEMIRKGAQVDAFGVGTKMGVSADAPYTDSAYKLVSYGGRPTMKLSTGKETLVCDKQVFRRRDRGKLASDTIALRTEKIEGTPLLEPVMRGGRRFMQTEPLTAIRERFLEEFLSLDDQYKALIKPALFPIGHSPSLESLQARTIEKVKKRKLGES